MVASIDCGASGHLLSTDVVSGEKADARLYLPTIENVRQMVDESRLLYIGDSKMSAIEIHAELARKGDFYLVTLAKVGGAPALNEQCLVPRDLCGSSIAFAFRSFDRSLSARLIVFGHSARPSCALRYAWTGLCGTPTCITSFMSTPITTAFLAELPIVHMNRHLSLHARARKCFYFSVVYYTHNTAILLNRHKSL